MKKFTKTFMAVAAVTAVSAAMSVSAMAMSAEYDNGTVTLKDVNSTGTSQTLLVLSQDATVTSENVDIVKQIDQKDDSTSFASVPVGTLADGTYYVRIGGTDGTLQTATFTVGGVQPGGETKKIIVGDANLDNSINAADALFVARKAGSADTNIAQAGTVYKKANSEETVIVGDANLDNSINAADALFVARKAGSADTNIAQAGTEIEVVAE